MVYVKAVVATIIGFPLALVAIAIAFEVIDRIAPTLQTIGSTLVGVVVVGWIAFMLAVTVGTFIFGLLSVRSGPTTRERR